MKPLLNICSEAIKHMRKLSKLSPKLSVFIGVKGGGCNGLKYVIEPMKHDIESLDEKMVIDDVDIVICGNSLIHLIGSNITWKTGFMGEGFDISNPNATGSCGCGETFSI